MFVLAAKVVPAKAPAPAAAIKVASSSSEDSSDSEEEKAPVKAPVKVGRIIQIIVSYKILPVLKAMSGGYAIIKMNVPHVGSCEGARCPCYRKEERQQLQQ